MRAMVSSARSSIAPEAIPRPIRSVILRMRSALFDLDEQKLSPPRRWLVVTGRFLWLVVRAFFRDVLQMRAASLSFSTLLAVVPALALAFAVAKATGYLAMLRDDTIMPFVEDTLGADASHDTEGVALLRSAVLGIVALVEGTSITGLGITGTVVLVVAVWRVVRGVDEAFHHVFEHRGPRRSVAQRIRAWLVVAFITPLGLSYAVTSASLSHGSAAMFVAGIVPIPWARDLLLFVVPPVVVSMTLFVLYMELPDTEVRGRSALFGGVVAGIAWYGMQLAHVRFQVGLARWNAIYSGFGAFPVLLASVQISWVIVLIGAQLVALHQHSPTLRVLAAGARRDFATLSVLGMETALVLVGRETPLPVRDIAVEVRADLVTLRVVLDSLETAGIISSIETATGGKRYLLGVDATTLRMSDVLAAIRRGPEAELPWREGSPELQRVLELHRQAGDTSEHNVTLAELRARATEQTSR
jgi:membrane protein